jgi:hypothetical protein
MLDNLDNEGPSDAVSDDSEVVNTFYGEQEPSEPTDEASEAYEEDDSEGDDSGVDDQPQDDPDEETLVFDKPNDFAKYEYDDDSGLYEFRSNGQKVKANIEKLINSFQADQKLNVELEKLSKAKKGEFEGTKQQELETLRSQAARFEEMSNTLESLIKDADEKIDWDELRQYDPPEYLKLKEQKEKRESALKEAREGQTKKQQERQVEVRKIEGAKLLDAIPEWSNVETRDKEIEEMRQYVFDNGFNQDEINQITDHRFWMLIRKASELEKIKTTKIKEVKKVPKTTKSKRSPAKSDTEKTDEEIFYGSN